MVSFLDFIWIAVNSKNAENIKKLLLSKGLFLPQIKVQRRNDYILFPAKRDVLKIKSEFVQYNAQFIEPRPEEVFVTKERPTSLKELLKNKLPKHLHEYIPSSYDIVGDIAIIELPESLVDYAPIIGNAILTLHKNVKSVFLKAGPVTGNVRIRPLKHIAGQNRTVTVHRENGCIYELDISKVYFSPRLSTEHKRVAEQVQDGEIVIDMFAGIGPFAILIARLKRATVYAIDVNPNAIFYLQRNITRNKLKGKVIPIIGDSREVITKQLSNVADRVIMNLPGESISFLDAAIKALRSSKGIIHIYLFESEPDPVHTAFQKIKEIILSKAIKIQNIHVSLLYGRKIKEVAPRRWYVVLDLAFSS